MKLTVIYRGEKTSPIRFGLARLEQAADSMGIRVSYDTYWNEDGPFLLAGIAGERFIEMTLARAGAQTEYRPEGGGNHSAGYNR